MNNPFFRLKHYTPDENDPRENHATECLAACLVFGENIRTSFVNFLVPTDKVFLHAASSDTEVVTQMDTRGFGRCDLIIQKPNQFIIVVEIKVQSPEDKAQLENYSHWLKTLREPRKFLFTLVRDPDQRLNTAECGVQNRYTWRQLSNFFQEELKGKNYSPTEINLVKNFCDYLERENIVINYRTQDLINFGPGVRAQKAMEGTFSELDSQLKANGFETLPIISKKNIWPHLKIRRQGWETIFGEGENWKILLFFTVPGIWERTDEEQHSFYPEIDLYHAAHRNDWKQISSKLQKWHDILKSNDFSGEAQQSGRDPQPIDPAKIQGEPYRIFYRNSAKEIKANHFPSSNGELITALIDCVNYHVGIIESLGNQLGSKRNQNGHQRS